MSTHALAGFSVVDPTVEGAHDALLVKHLSSHSQVGAHVEAICRKGVDLTVGSAIDHDVVTVHVDCPSLSRPNFCSLGHVVPSIGVGRRRFS
jgi:hypothetical protein